MKAQILRFHIDPNMLLSRPAIRALPIHVELFQYFLRLHVELVHVELVQFFLRLHVELAQVFLCVF